MSVFRLGLLLLVLVGVPVVEVAAQPALADGWFPILSSSPAAGGLTVGSDHLPPRLYVGTGGSRLASWSAWEYRPASGEWTGTFTSVTFEQWLVELLVGDFLPLDSQVLAVLNDGQVVVYDEASYREVGRFTAGGKVEHAAIADLDLDGRDELVVAGGGTVRAYDADGLLWSAGGYDGLGIAVGRFTPDAGVEVALRDRVLDGATGMVELEYDSPGGFHVLETAGDVDGDDLDEILFRRDVTDKLLVDPRRNEVLWDRRVLGRGARFADFEGDRRPELVVLASGGVRVYDAVDPGVQLWSWIPGLSTSSPTRLLTGDVDRDGDVEVVWGTINDGQLVVAEAEGADRWLSPPLFDLMGPVAGDLDGDGRDELVVASGSWLRPGNLVVFDRETLALAALSPSLYELALLAGSTDLELRDLDGDGRDEILLAGKSRVGSDAAARVVRFDGSTFSLDWASPPLGEEVGNTSYAVEGSDLDGDGRMEILVAGSTDGATHLHVVALDYQTGAEIWRTERLFPPSSAPAPTRITELRVGDVDGDGGQEVVTLVLRRGSHVLDATNGDLEQVLAGDFRSLALGGRPSPLRPALWVGTGEGVETYERRDGMLRRGAAFGGTGPVSGIAPGQRPGQVWITDDGRLRLLAIRGPRMREVWRSEPYLLLGPPASLCDEEGRVAAAGFTGMFSFRVPRGAARMHCRQGLRP